jgi:hypothetical protein
VTSAPADDVGTPVRVVMDGMAFAGRLWDNPAARALVEQLPLTLVIADLNGVEKLAPLPAALPMDGMPAGDDPAPLDIGYYDPSGDLVLYYGEVGYWDGIARLGTIDVDPARLGGLPDGTTVTIEVGDRP